MSDLDLKNLPEREEEIDFSDIYEKHQINVEDDLDTIIVVDGAPIVDEAKEEKLRTVLTKLFTKNAGEIKENGIWMPMAPNASGKRESKGFLFIDFETPEAAHAAIKNLDGHKMSKSHQLSVNRFSDVEKYATMSDEYVPPVQEEFKPKEHLKSWLMDPQARDQFFVYHGNDAGIYWNRKSEKPEEVYSRRDWTQGYLQWSPLGSYIATFHSQGIALWGGPSWAQIVRFYHPGVRLIDFSPNERYLVTWSTEPINLSRIPANTRHPFSDYDEGNQTIVWDIKTGALLRTFPSTQSESQQKTVRWPMFKWSPSDKYFARVVPGQQLSVYEAPSMTLLDKKSIKIDGIVDFEWSPALGGKADPKLNQKEEVLSYWTPEVGNQPARVTIMAMPSKEIVRTKNLFNVTECSLYWQSQGYFLAVKVNRHTKTKKSQFTNLEIFRMCEKAIPVETLEIKDPVLKFAWEPNGERFATISTNDPAYGAAPNQSGAAAPTTIKTAITFYYLDTSKAVAGFRPLKKIEKKTANNFAWSPKGRHIVLATIRSPSSHDIEFWDLDFEPAAGSSLSEAAKKEGKKEVDSIQLLATQEHYGVTDIEWDPTGRYVASGSSAWHHSVDHGFAIWDFKGQQLIQENIDNFKLLQWRPRPKTLLSDEQKKKIRKNLRQYSKIFDEEDLAAGDANAAKLIAARRKAVEEWYAWRKQAEKQMLEERKAAGKELRSTQDDGKSETIEEWVEEVIDEVEEIVD
ncbi:hypothetical protein BX666DRAFT_1939833 [Dichotomocladium elegans]|nr:hypothetical protein BX666DRAFT_1939833 [Dichotomocladium elegans]